MPSNYSLDYETTDDESCGSADHSPPIPTRANGIKAPESEAGRSNAEEEDVEIDDAFSIDLNDEEFRVKRTDENEHLFDIDGNYVGPVERDFESCSENS